MKRIKKVLLVNPPAKTNQKARDINPIPPIGLGYIAAMLEQRQIKVEIYDMLGEGWNKEIPYARDIVIVGLSTEDLIDRIYKFEPDIVGISNQFTYQKGIVDALFSAVKSEFPQIITVTGGASPTVIPEITMQNKAIDYAVLSEGEHRMIHLIDYLEGRKSPEEIDGLAYREGETLIVNPVLSFIQNLDDIPFPAHHLFNWDVYFSIRTSHGTRKTDKYCPIVSSRGCMVGCVFCCVERIWGRKYRVRGISNVIQEFKILKNRFGIKEIMFEDDNLTLNMKRTGQMFDAMAQEKLNLIWDTPNGVSTFALSNELLDKMKASGCVQVNLAVESGNQDVLKNIMSKPVNLSAVKSLVSHGRKIDLPVSAFLVVGMPGETIEQMWDSIKFVKKLGIYHPHISVATPYPGTRLYDICQKNGYLKPDFSYDDLFIRSFCITTPQWNSEQLQNFLTKAEQYLHAEERKNSYGMDKVDYIFRKVQRVKKLGQTFLSH
jgi:anaerobic magnesium-protoporphyrin IX monomethyl ester cyclase